MVVRISVPSEIDISKAGYYIATSHNRVVDNAKAMWLVLMTHLSMKVILILRFLYLESILRYGHVLPLLGVVDLLQNLLVVPS